MKKQILFYVIAFPAFLLLLYFLNYLSQNKKKEYYQSVQNDSEKHQLLERNRIELEIRSRQGDFRAQEILDLESQLAIAYSSDQPDDIIELSGKLAKLYLADHNAEMYEYYKKIQSELKK